MTNFELSMVFFLQAAVILCACRLVASVARAIGQPEVVGQMVAGVLLGPSLLGVAFPQLHQWLFPVESRPAIYIVAQFGLALYMFLVGLEFRVDLLRTNLRAAATISCAGIVAPFALGGLVAALLFPRHDLFAEGVSRTHAIMFLGAAMSITAFPMMARIISEQRLSNTRIGTLLLAAGAVDDAVAWCVLAAVLSIMGDGWKLGATALGGTFLFIVVARLILRPLLRRLSRSESGDANDERHTVSPDTLLIMLVLLAASAWFTDLIGIHAVFGAFVLGLFVPRGSWCSGIHRTLMPITSVLLVPIFFASSGLTTRLTLVASWSLWGIACIVVIAAITGKFAACAAAARASGEGLRESLAIGSMMNARGLMGLIILNVGLEKGVITPTLFAIGVIMTIVTTLMATPLFEMFHGKPRALPELSTHSNGSTKHSVSLDERIMSGTTIR